MEVIKNIFNEISIFDLIYIIITILYLIRCSIKGFVLSLLSAAKWLLAYVLTLIVFPKAKPYVKGIIDNEYVLDILLGLSLFIIIIFFILLVNKGIKKTVVRRNLIFIVSSLNSKKLIIKKQSCTYKYYCISKIKCWPV